MSKLRNLLVIATTLILGSLNSKADNQLKSALVDTKQKNLSDQLKSHDLIKTIDVHKGSAPANCVGNLSD